MSRSNAWRRISRLGLANSKLRGWYRKYVHRRNRKKLRQSLDIENHQDRPLDPWAID